MATTDPSAPTYTPETYPGKGLGIAGFIVSFFFSLVGLILSIIAYVQSRKAGYKNGLALAGIILGSVFTVIGTIIAVLGISAAFTLAAKCEELGPGVHMDGSTTITCGSSSSYSSGSSFESN